MEKAQWLEVIAAAIRGTVKDGTVVYNSDEHTFSYQSVYEPPLTHEIAVHELVEIDWTWSEDRISIEEAADDGCFDDLWEHVKRNIWQHLTCAGRGCFDDLWAHQEKTVLDGDHFILVDGEDVGLMPIGARLGYFKEVLRVRLHEPRETHIASRTPAPIIGFLDGADGRVEKGTSCSMKEVWLLRKDGVPVRGLEATQDGYVWYKFSGSDELNFEMFVPAGAVLSAKCRTYVAKAPRDSATLSRFRNGIS